MAKLAVLPTLHKAEDLVAASKVLGGHEAQPVPRQGELLLLALGLLQFLLLQKLCVQ